MTASLRSNQEWNRLAAADPLHAIASDKGRRRHQGTAWTSDQFLAKGAVLYGLVRPLVLRTADRGSAVDIGCGAGRLSRQLASDFARVIGVDVAARMIAMAEDLNRDLPNVEFRVGPGGALPVESESANLVFSLQVLQHVDPEALPGLLQDVARVLKPDGRVLVHIPRSHWRQRLTAATRLAGLRRSVTRAALAAKPDLDVSRWPWVVSQYHTYPAGQVLGWFEAAGLRHVEQHEFRPGKPHSAVYFATKA
jgi:SAM-dependent methyltransferase